MSKRTINEHYKYNKLIAALRKKIFSGEFDETGKLPPERKLAEMFDFSRVTIRTALKELIKDGLIIQKPGAGTFVNFPDEPEIKHQLKEYRFCFICNKPFMDIPPEDDPFNSQLLLGILRSRKKRCRFKLDTAAFDVSLYQTAEFIQKNIEQISQYDGIILAADHNAADIDFLFNLQIPFVAIGDSGLMRQFCVVSSDNFQGAYSLTCHLLKSGSRTPLLIKLDSDRIWNLRRLAGFKQALADSGIDFDENKNIIECDPHTIEEAKQFGYKLLENKDNFDSLLIMRDIHAAGILEAFKEKHFSVPCALYDGYQWINNLYPELPYISQPFVEMGEAAIGILLDKLDTGTNVTTTKVIPSKLHIPENTSHIKERQTK